jgi:hypothetical protein
VKVINFAPSWHLGIYNIRLPRGSDCDPDHYLVISEVREKLLISKQVMQQFGMERFHLEKINDVEVKKQLQIYISNRYATLENLGDNADIKGA